MALHKIWKYVPSEFGSTSTPKLHENQTSSFNKMSIVHKIVHNMKCTVKPSRAIRHVMMELVYSCFINIGARCPVPPARVSRHSNPW